ncbi:amino acid transporter AVT6C [Aristolochia californica]|uniref:amino acid transporter AVT6C n=1 Tax=Aristolochia californica TaxID=171875 RepID=UPI0035E2B272
MTLPKDAEASAPLLPVKATKAAASDGASVSSAVFNLSTSIIGAGIMSIPATLKVLGVGPALLLIFAVAFLAEVSVEFLMRFTHSGATNSYAGVMGESFGRLGSTALRICIILTTMGCLIIYLIIIGDVLAASQSGGKIHLGVLQEWLGVHWWTTRDFVLFVLVIALLPLCMLKRVDSLRFSSAISVLLAVVFVVISSGMAIHALFQGTVKSPRLLPDTSGDTSFLDLFTAVPVIVTAFTFHFNVHPIRIELQKSSDMTRAVQLSLIICAVIYAAVGFFGYLLFGESTMADILANFDHSSGSNVSPLFNDLVRLSYALHLILVFPLLNFSLRISIDGLLFPKSPPLASAQLRFTAVTMFLLGSIYLLAVVIPNIWLCFQFIGSTTGVCIAFIFPGAIVLRDKHGISSRRDRILASTMMILAVLASLMAITSNITNLL